jgi:hypothetical protein
MFYLCLQCFHAIHADPSTEDCGAGTDDLDNVEQIIAKAKARQAELLKKRSEMQTDPATWSVDAPAGTPLVEVGAKVRRLKLRFSLCLPRRI